MTAERMFEELGYELVNNNKYFAKYEKPVKSYQPATIIFIKHDYKVFVDINWNDAETINKIVEAINKQIEELKG